MAPNDRELQLRCARYAPCHRECGIEADPMRSAKKRDDFLYSEKEDISLYMYVL